MSEAPIPAGIQPAGGPPRPTPSQTARLTVRLTAVAAPAFWLFYSRIWVSKLHQTELWARDQLIVPDGWLSAALCALVGSGVAILLSIGILNRRRARPMFRPTTTKLVAMFVYGMLAPVGLFYILPIGGWSILLSFFSPVRLVESGRLLHALGLMASLLAMSYAVVSMVTYGIRNYMMRGLLFCAVWISLFAARILLSGVYKGPL